MLFYLTFTASVLKRISSNKTLSYSSLLRRDACVVLSIMQRGALLDIQSPAQNMEIFTLQGN